VARPWWAVGSAGDLVPDHVTHRKKGRSAGKKTCIAVDAGDLTPEEFLEALAE